MYWGIKAPLAFSNLLQRISQYVTVDLPLWYLLQYDATTSGTKAWNNRRKVPVVSCDA